MIPEFKLPSVFAAAAAEFRAQPSVPTVVFDRSSRKNTKITDYFVGQAERKWAVTHEGSPVYLWPHTDRLTQQWNNRAFIGGHEMAIALANALPPELARHAVLLDDFNGRPSDTGDAEMVGQLQGLFESSPVIPVSPIFDSVSHPQTIRFSESSFQREGRANTCSTLDSGFQREKILSLFDRGIDDDALPGKEKLGTLHDTLLVVVHPLSFRRQQGSMINALLSAMKQPPFGDLPKLERRALISNMYRHVWLHDVTGEPVAVTQPVWDTQRNTFDFREVVDL